MKHRTKLVVAAPIVAVATLMIGLRVGAGSGFHAALVYGAPPGRAAPGEPRRYAFQMITYFEERGVREAIAMKDLSVELRDAEGHEARWTGASNEDGVAEITFSMPPSSGATPGGLAFDARVAGDREPLAFGIVDLTKAPPRVEERRDARVRPSKREGLAMDVYVESGRLVVGSPHDLWVHVSSDAGAPVVHATPEVGLAFLADDAKADCHGYAKLEATALGQAASTQLEATGPNGEKGVWFGTIPTAPGAFSIQMPSVFITDDVKPEAREAIVIAPNPRRIAYVEIVDAEGRVWAAALPLAVEPGDPLPRAHVPLGHLAEGTYWLVASGDPRGASTLEGATIGKRFVVSARSRCAECDRACDRGLDSAELLASRTPRWLALDGIATRGAQNRARHRRGLFIGLVALGAAALLEALLLTQAAREARLALAAAASDEPREVGSPSTSGPRTADRWTSKSGNLAVALLVALLGFAFLAALIIAKA